MEDENKTAPIRFGDLRVGCLFVFWEGHIKYFGLKTAWNEVFYINKNRTEYLGLGKNVTLLAENFYEYFGKQ